MYNMKVLRHISSACLTHFFNCFSIRTFTFPLKPSLRSSAFPSSECSYRSPISSRASSSSSVFIPPDDLSSDSNTKEQKKRIAGVDQNKLLDPFLLADSDSCFCEFEGVSIHHKMCESNTSSSTSSKLCFPFILLHGFGASVFSWNSVMKPLSDLTTSKILAFDRPAFGLTSRLDWQPKVPQSVASLNPYGMEFSVLATQYFIDSLTTDKAVLIGHSAGCLVALNSYFEAPQKIAALVLVAPAIFAPRNAQKVARGSKKMENQTKENTPKKNFFYLFFSNILLLLSRWSQQIASEMKKFVSTVFQKTLTAFLSSVFGVMLVRYAMDKFAISAVKRAWHDANLVTQDVINGYTKPLGAKGWDKALTSFMAAMVSSAGSNGNPPLSERLHEISCPVLIITGDNDRIVPFWNSRRLSENLPGCYFEVIKQCGHLPQEEKSEEFVSAVQKFLHQSFLNLMENSETE